MIQPFGLTFMIDEDRFPFGEYTHTFAYVRARVSFTETVVYGNETQHAPAAHPRNPRTRRPAARARGETGVNSLLVPVPTNF